MDTAIDVNKFFEYNNPTVLYKGYSKSVYMNSNAMNMN